MTKATATAEESFLFFAALKPIFARPCLKQRHAATCFCDK